MKRKLSTMCLLLLTFAVSEAFSGIPKTEE